MARQVQKRTLETRARLLAAAEQSVARSGFDTLRVEEVVAGAGVAKGTFFAHFADKDALMERLIGARLDVLLADLDGVDAPQDVSALAHASLPLMRFMVCERYVFDLILRYSGAARVENIGPIAMCFGRHEAIMVRWMQVGPFRRDVHPKLLAEGVQAFLIQTLALHFCALHRDMAMEDRFVGYLTPWLLR